MFRIFAAVFTIAFPALAERPANWAQPIPGSAVKNLHRITPQLFRSAQPDAAGMRALEKLGIRTVVNLRNFNDDEREARGTGLRLLNVDMSAWRIKDEEVAKVLALLRKEMGPFLVHCQHGADRTGVICAMFRVVEQRWSKGEAIRELTGGGFGFHAIWKNIPDYVRNADVEKIRRRVNELSR